MKRRILLTIALVSGAFIWSCKDGSQDIVPQSSNSGSSSGHLLLDGDNQVGKNPVVVPVQPVKNPTPGVMNPVIKTEGEEKH